MTHRRNMSKILLFLMFGLFNLSSQLEDHAATNKSEGGPVITIQFEEEPDSITKLEGIRVTTNQSEEVPASTTKLEGIPVTPSRSKEVPKDVSCLEDWTKKSDNKCYSLHRHNTRKDGGLTQQDCIDICYIIGGKIAEPTNMTLFLSTFPSAFPELPYGIWIGANDFVKEGVWMGYSGKQLKIQPENWWHDEPTGLGRSCLGAKVPDYLASDTLPVAKLWDSVCDAYAWCLCQY